MPGMFEEQQKGHGEGGKVEISNPLFAILKSQKLPPNTEDFAQTGPKTHLATNPDQIICGYLVSTFA